MTTQAALVFPTRGIVAAGGYARLAKPKIAALSTLSAAAGFLLAAPGPCAQMLPSLGGLFLLACGSGALNQIQEHDVDARMRRTCGRPLPVGEIRPGSALVYSIGLLLCGLALLRRGGGEAAALLGLGAVLWYNGVYTPLKTKTVFAFLPGALVGALPPAIGWASAGGDLCDPRILALCGLLFLWQVPHFGLLLLAHGAEYAAAGLPVLTDAVPPRRLAQLIFLGVLGTAAGGLLLPLPGLWAPLRLLQAGAFVALVASGVKLLSGGQAASRGVFHAINGYLLLVLTLAVVAGVCR